MNIVTNNYLSKGLILLAVNCVLSVQSVNANDTNEWQNDYVSKSGFSEFSPPSASERYSSDIGSKQWASGSSFNEENRVRYTPSASKNPWKPVRSSYKKTFGGKRPWGNVPDRKPKTSNMKLHDQRFKQWINQRDSSYRSFSALSDPLSNYGYPGSMYNDPLITPSIYPGPMFGYSGQRYPRPGFLPGSRFW